MMSSYYMDECYKEPSILDKLASSLKREERVTVDEEKAYRSLKFLQYKWKGLQFAKVIRVQGMGSCHFVKQQKRGEPSIYIQSVHEYEEQCNRDRMMDRKGEENFRKSTLINYEWGFYGWARGFNGEIFYLHHSNYAQIDFGLYGRSKDNNHIFELHDKSVTKTPKIGDYICGVVKRSDKFEDKFEMSPWFICSYTLYRLINLIKYGKNSKMFKGEKLNSRLIASLITRGNEVVYPDQHHENMHRFMTPVNCEDVALVDHFIYSCIAMILVMKSKLNDRSYWPMSKVDGMNYWDFILNIGNNFKHSNYKLTKPFDDCIVPRNNYERHSHNIDHFYPNRNMSYDERFYNERTYYYMNKGFNFYQPYRSRDYKPRNRYNPYHEKRNNRSINKDSKMVEDGDAKENTMKGNVIFVDSSSISDIDNECQDKKKEDLNSEENDNMSDEEYDKELPKLQEESNKEVEEQANKELEEQAKKELEELEAKKKVG